MDSKELWEEFELDYATLLLYLKQKYGMVAGSYFTNETCKYVDKNLSRANEGIFIHHDKEWNPDHIECRSLCAPEEALKYSFDYQQPYNLTYCNMLEHLLIHIKIYELRLQAVGYAFIDGVEQFMIPQINDIYNTYYFSKIKWLQATKDSIQDNYKDYQQLLKYYSSLCRAPVEYLNSLTNRKR